MKTVILSAFLLLAANSDGLHQYASTIRPPAYPLAVRSPFCNFWLPGNTLPGVWPTFWEGTIKGWTGFIRVDNQAFTFMGNPQDLTGLIQVAIQKSSHVTPTQTVFVIQAGPVDLTVTFNSPVEYQDEVKQSIPLSYVFITAKPTDGKSHAVQVYMDISAEWAGSIKSKVARWDLQNRSGLKIWTTELQVQHKFAEHLDYAEWGQGVLATTAEAQHMSGSAVPVRKEFVTTGALPNTHDDNYRCIECNWPVMAFAHDLGSISAESKEIEFVVGHVREENINLVGVPQKALWTSYFGDKEDMIIEFFNDVEHAKQLAEATDEKLLNEAFAIGGQDHADIISFSLRQAYGGTEFSGNRTHPVLYQKEISSNGNMQTVDVMYPAVPMHYYMNVKYLQYLLEPLFFQMENGLFFKEFAMHDIGQHFPNATGYPEGNSYDMPVEESGNMLLMVGDIVFHPKANVAESIAYVKQHYPIMSQWANYLYHNCLYPVNQLTTDDFIGPTQLNSGLALKGILGMKAFAKMSELIGEQNATDTYNKAVEEFIVTWKRESLHHSGGHLKMEYNVTEGYQFKYNAYQDKLLNMSVVPEDVYAMEAAFYLTKEEIYGTPFVFTHDYTKSDWEMWTAAAFGVANPTLKEHIVRNMAKYLRETPSRVPFSDWYVTATGVHMGFKNRPVAGGHFALMSMSPSVSA